MSHVEELQKLRQEPNRTQEQEEALDEAIRLMSDSFAMMVEHSRELPNSHPLKQASVDD